MSASNDLPTIDLIRNELQKCVGCGNCLYSCPVYAQSSEEDYVARGRNRILKQASGDPRALEAGARDRFSKCLLCGRCTSVCPQGVRNDLITMAARSDLVRVHGLPLTKAVAFRTLMKDREKMRSALKMAEKVQWLLPGTRSAQAPLKHLPSEPAEKIRHLPLVLAGLGGGRHLPSLAKKSLSELLPEDNPPAPGVAPRGLRVAYFSGCATEFCVPEAGKALVQNLTRLGVHVFFPKAQGCCGLAVYANGDLDTAADIAAHNLEVLSGFDADLVVTGCATCGSALKKGWLDLARTEQERLAFSQLSSKVRDLSELIVELSGYQPLRYRSILPPDIKVTYHNPCHLGRHQHVIEQPRKILKHVFGANFIEMDNNGCCGCGGSFSIAHYPLAQEIGARKIESIARTEADAVITSCPGCMIQLIDGIERRGLKTKVVDISEAIEPVPQA